MKKCLLLTALLATATAVSGGWAWVELHRSAVAEQAAGFERKRAAFAETENERLRGLVAGYEKAKRETTQAPLRAEIEKATARIRGLAFKEPVVYDVLTRAGIKKVLLGKIAEQYGDDAFEQVRLGYVALGLVPADYPLKERYIDLLGEQVAAFYDQHMHRLYMFEDATLDASQNRVILSHELTHALQDQHFNLSKLPLELKDNDDRALAASALVEGDATLEMNQFFSQDLSLKGVGQNIAAMFTQSLDQIQAAPRILRESLLFPYTAGLQFCMTLQMQGDGFQGISAAYQRPPASTAQILHPEKYFANEQPIAVTWPDLTASGQKLGADNVLGELGTRILLTDWADAAAAPKIAEGWRGDRYLVFNQGHALVWRTVWAGPREAEQFVAAAKQMLAKRYGAQPLPEESKDGVKTIDFKGSQRTLKLIAPKENEWVLVDASDAAWAAALAEKFAK